MILTKLRKRYSGFYANYNTTNNICSIEFTKLEDYNNRK